MELLAGHKYGCFAGDAVSARMMAQMALPKGTLFLVLSRGYRAVGPMDDVVKYAWFTSDCIEEDAVKYELAGHKIVGRFKA